MLRVLTDTVILPRELGLPVEKYYFFLLGVIVLPSLAFNFQLNTQQLNKAFLIIGSVFFIICIYSLSVFNFEFVNGSQRLWGGRVIHPITLGHIAVSNIIVSLFFLSQLRRTKEFLLIGINVLLSLFTLSLTESRGPILALLIVLFLYLFFVAKLNKKQVYWVFSIIFGFIVFLLFFTEFSNRFFYTVTKGGARLEHWRIALNQFIESPIWGSSLEENVHKIYPHNIFIESFMVLGVLGGVIFVFLSTNYIRKGYYVLKDKNNHSKWISLLFVQYFTASMFSGSLITNSLVWYLGIMLMNIDTNNSTISRKKLLYD